MAEPGIDRSQSEGEDSHGNNELPSGNRRKSQWDVPRKYSQGEAKRRSSQTAASPKNANCDILKRSNKKYSVANAVAVIGVTKALLIGFLSKDKNQESAEEDLYSLISSTTDLNISVNTSESCIDLTRPIILSTLESSSDSECDGSQKSLSAPITDNTGYKGQGTEENIIANTINAISYTNSEENTGSSRETPAGLIASDQSQQQDNKKMDEMVLDCKQLPLVDYAAPVYILSGYRQDAQSQDTTSDTSILGRENQIFTDL